MGELEPRSSPVAHHQCQGALVTTVGGGGGDVGGGSQWDATPQWLHEIRDNSTPAEADEAVVHAPGEQEDGRRSSLLNFGECLHNADGLILSRPSSSARFGRRAQPQQNAALTTPPNHEVAGENIVPRFGDFKSASMPNWRDDKLEKSWKSLSVFQQSHKGRLDSAKYYHRAAERKRIGDQFETTTLSPISPTNSTNSSAESTSYSPSICEPDVPNVRSRSEMSSYMPQYVYAKIRKATEGGGAGGGGGAAGGAPMLGDNILTKTISNFNTLSKSRSTENLFGVSYSGKPRHHAGGSRDFHGSEESLATSRLSDYKQKVARENELRQAIINELLLENELIANRATKQALPVSRNDDVFVIPELPVGKLLRIIILSTWGDKYYVGLNGIEIFGDDGKIAPVDRITASPSDVNVLPENANDPRVVTNLLDGVNRTQDDVHLWLAPFTNGDEHTITIEFNEPCVISMMRFWNYNKSRIHSHRGARDVVMELDGCKIFQGEIAKACGGIIGGVDKFGDTILFTTNEDILEAISLNDHAYPTLTAAKIDSPPVTEERPLTSALTTSNGIRPRTGQSPFAKSEASDDADDANEQILLGCKRLDAVLLSNWGYANVIGLTAMEIIESGELPVPMREEYIVSTTAQRRIKQSRLFDDETITTDHQHMWLTEFMYGEPVKITLEFDRVVFISGLRIWNYNANLEMTYAGVSRMQIQLDGRPVANPATKDATFLLRRAPGNTNYDFVQEILLGDGSSLVHRVERVPSFIISNNLGGQAECPLLPEGFVIEIVVYSTWGDQYYCGLNGLEIYDHMGRKLMLDECNVCAYPESINVLPETSGDTRTPDKLIDNVNDCDDGTHSWLAPVLPKALNRIYVVLDQPVCISVIKFWNYSKNAARGVKEFGILLDDLLIYNGIMDKFNKRDKCKYRTVVFTDDLKVVEDESNTLLKPTATSVTRTATSGSLPIADPALRPFTAVSPYLRTTQSQ